jgi:glucose/arabinose dehydrogenase
MLPRIALLLLLTLEVQAASRPATPLIIEPEHDLLVVSPGDVHMVTAAFSDPDGDAHRCTDWEIAGADGTAWRASCVEGAEKIHIHMGDGEFAGAYTGRRELHADAEYTLRARHRDDSGDAATEWSDWSERLFRTSVPNPMEPMRLRDVLAQPAARWTASGAPLPSTAGVTLSLEQLDGARLLEVDGDTTTDHEALPSRAAVRVVMTAPAGTTIPESELAFEDEKGDRRTVYLPAIELAPGAPASFWISTNGSSHHSEPGSRVPDFERIARGAPVPWRVRQRGFEVDVFASGFELPVNVAFARGPFIGDDAPYCYVAELYGSIKVVTVGGEVRDFATGLLDFDPTGYIPGSGESGVAGIVVDPANGDVYVTAVYWPDKSIRELYPRVLRLRPSADGLTAESIETVAGFVGERQSASHQISNITIGPDRKLYVHLGDSAVHEYAQDMSTIRGKILRMDLDGTPADDNPFFDAGDGVQASDYIWALGLRNPFGGAWREEDQSLYAVENGPFTDRLSKIVRGRNYLWDGTDDSMRNYAVATWQAPAAPVQIAFVERSRFGGSRFPWKHYGSAFVTESGPTWGSGAQPIGKRITELVLDGDERVARRATLVEYDGTGKATAAGIAAGPDGLYFTDLYRDWGYETPIDRGANLLRVRWTGHANFEARVASSDGLTMDYIDSSDAAGAERWSWDLGDGTVSSERFVRHRYAAAGTYVVRLTVSSAERSWVETKHLFVGPIAAARLTAAYSAIGSQSTPVTRGERLLDFDWGDGSPDPLVPADHFAARYSVTIVPRFSESYRFVATTSDRLHVRLDGAAIIDVHADGDAPVESSAEIELEAGRAYEVEVSFDHDEGPAMLRLTWESDSQRVEPLPGTSGLPRRRAVR